MTYSTYGGYGTAGGGGTPGGSGPGTTNQTPNRPTGRRIFLKVVAGTAVGVVGGGGTVWWFLRRASAAATPYLARLAEQFALVKVEEGLEWLASKGIKEIRGFMSDEGSKDSEAHKPVPQEVYRPGPGSPGAGALGAVPEDHPEAPPKVVLLTGDGGQVVLMPRAAQTISRVFARMKSGDADGLVLGTTMGPMSDREAMSYLYPEKIVQNGQKNENPFLSYETASSRVEIQFDRAGKREILTVTHLGSEYLSSKWSFPVGVDKAMLA